MGHPMRQVVPTVWFAVATLVAGCPTGSGAPAVDAADPDLASSPTSFCSSAREPTDGKLTPDLLRFYDVAPGPRQVLIGYKTSANVQPLPDCGGPRECPERTAAIAALDREVMELQRCTVERIMAVGGQFLERFWLGNITLARLSRTQSLDVAGLTDVRLIEDAEAPRPPPP
jgi:hypothetical protein